MTETNPSISIIIPTYNRPDLVVLSVRSALDALPEGGEVIVTDDQSDPPASKALASLHHPALQVTVNSNGRGAAANRNHAARQARGAVLLFLDDDDLILPDYPARILTAIRSVPQSTWGFSATTQHDAAVTTPPQSTSKEHDFAPLPGATMRRRIAGLGCGFWIKRDCFNTIGGIDEGLTVNEDTDLSLKLLTQGHEPLYSAIPGVSLLRHGQASLTRGTDLAERMRCFRTILDRYADFLASNPRGHLFILRRYLKVAAKHGAFRQGMRSALNEGPPGARPANLALFLTTLALHAPRRRP